MVELDSTLSQGKERDWVFMVTIPMSTSRRAALQNYTENMRCLSAAQTWRLWKNSSRLYVVWHRWRLSGTSAPQPCARRECDSNTARLDFPVRSETSDGVLTERIESKYRGLFDRINKELRAEQKRADDKTKDELKALEKLNATDPEKLLDGYIKKWSTESSSMQVLWPRRHHKGTPRLPKSLKPLPLRSRKKRLVPWRRPGERKGLTVQKQRQGQRQDEQQGQEQGQEREG